MERLEGRSTRSGSPAGPGRPDPRLGQADRHNGVRRWHLLNGFSDIEVQGRGSGRAGTRRGSSFVAVTTEISISTGIASPSLQSPRQR